MADKNKKQTPKQAGFDKNPQDFFRGSAGFTKGLQQKFRQRDFTGFRRGSR